MYLADLPNANLVDIRMPCKQGSVTRKVLIIGKVINRRNDIQGSSDMMKSKTIVLGGNVFYGCSHFLYT